MSRTIPFNNLTLKVHRQNLKNIFSANKSYLESVVKIKKKLFVDFFLLSKNYSRRICKSTN